MIMIPMMSIVYHHHDPSARWLVTESVSCHSTVAVCSASTGVVVVNIQGECSKSKVI